MKIALDAMGGDLAPKAAIEGAVIAARDFKIEVVLVGDEAVIARELAEHNTKGLAISVEHASRDRRNGRISARIHPEQTRLFD